VDAHIQSFITLLDAHMMDKVAPHTSEQLATTKCESENAHNSDSLGEDVPPDGGYGWVCVAACFTINCFTWGAVSVSQHLLSVDIHSADLLRSR
jgi:hypothetical protein